MVCFVTSLNWVVICTEGIEAICHNIYGLLGFKLDISFDRENRGYMVVVSLVTLCCDDVDMYNYIEWPAMVLACSLYIAGVTMLVDFVSRSKKNRNQHIASSL